MSELATGNWRELAAFFVERKGYVKRAEKKAEVINSGLFFFASFLLEEQKK